MQRQDLAIARGVYYRTEGDERMADLLRRLADDVEHENWSLLSVDIGVDTEGPGTEYVTALYEQVDDALERMGAALAATPEPRSTT